MLLIEKWKNRETKKKLREENERLKKDIALIQEAKSFQDICSNNMSIKEVQAKVEVSSIYKDIPDWHIKHDAARKLFEHLCPFVEYQMKEYLTGARACTASLYIAIGDRSYEENPNTF